MRRAASIGEETERSGCSSRRLRTGVGLNRDKRRKGRLAVCSNWRGISIGEQTFRSSLE